MSHFLPLLYTTTMVAFRISWKKLFGRYEGSNWTVKNEFGYKFERKKSEKYSRLDNKNKQTFMG